MTIGERIRTLREGLGLKGVQLAARSGLDQSYLSKLERDVVGWSMEGITAIARELGVTPGSLLDSDEVVPAAQGGTRIPLIDYVPAGLPRGIAQNYRNDDVGGFIVTDLADSDELFGMTIRGRSMEPEFRDGDKIIVRYGLSPHPGDFVVGTDRELRESTFKRYKELKTGPDGRTIFALVPLNDDFPTLRSDERPLEIVGTLVRHLRDYRR